MKNKYIEDKIPQQKYYEREYFTSQERTNILSKSNGVCCHCGKEIYVGYTMTVDHFIPLNKGGSNRFINLIPLCEDCNKTKDNKLYSIDYIKYIKDKYKKEIGDYLTSYISVTDYVQRHRLLAYDEYDMNVYMPIFKGHNKKSNKKSELKIEYKIKLATWDDLPKLHEYLVRYLKKYNSFEDENSTRENLIFWMQFGCIYYIEKDNDIKLMVAITIKHMSSDEDFRGINNQPNMYIFSYYNTDVYLNTLMTAIYEIPMYIVNENNITFAPVNILFLDKDKKKDFLASCWQAKLYKDSVVGFSVIHVLAGKNHTMDADYLNSITQSYEEMSDEEKTVYDFFKKFDDVSNMLVNYFETYPYRKDISWMSTSIFSVEFIKKIDKLANMINLINPEITENTINGDKNGDEQN